MQNSPASQIVMNASVCENATFMYDNECITVWDYHFYCMVLKCIAST